MSPGPMSLMPDLSSPRSENCRANVAAGAAGPQKKQGYGWRSCAGLSGRHENEQRIGLQIVRPLQERREVRIGERHFQRVEDLAAALGEIRLEDFAGLGVVTATAKPDRASCDLRSAQVSSQWVNLT